MIFYQLDYVVDEVLKNIPSEEQVFLKKYLNADYPKKEAKYLWERIADHKWLVSERLRRDIGFRVAAVDYVENFYAPDLVFGNKNKKSGVFGKFIRPLNSTLKSYFVSKSKILPQ
jgi:hypothetical protein